MEETCQVQTKKLNCGCCDPVVLFCVREPHADTEHLCSIEPYDEPTTWIRWKYVTAPDHG